MKRIDRVMSITKEREKDSWDDRAAEIDCWKEARSRSSEA
jgi:hypothetical protein